MPTKQVTVELTERTHALLAVLSPTGDVADVLGTLANHAADGLARPGAWERAWVAQVPWEAEDWEDQLVQDPEAHWRQVPRAELDESECWDCGRTVGDRDPDLDEKRWTVAVASCGCVLCDTCTNRHDSDRGEHGAARRGRR